MLIVTRPLEFKKFVQQTEHQLLLLFNSIDRDNNGKLDKKELQAAFLNAGLCVPMRRLTEFFNEIDLNNDGYISFDEWRYVFCASVVKITGFATPYSPFPSATGPRVPRLSLAFAFFYHFQVRKNIAYIFTVIFSPWSWGRQRR